LTIQNKRIGICNKIELFDVYVKPNKNICPLTQKKKKGIHYNSNPTPILKRKRKRGRNPNNCILKIFQPCNTKNNSPKK